LYTHCWGSYFEEALEKLREVALEVNLPEFEAYVVPPNAWEGLLKVQEDGVQFGVGLNSFNLEDEVR